MAAFAKSTLRRAARIALFAGGGLVGFCALVTIAALLILRTSYAEQKLAELLVRLPAEQGFSLKFGTLEGPLPGRLALRDLVIGDKDGPLARVAELELGISLGSLLAGSAEAELLVRDAELLRLPPPGPPAEPSPPFNPADLRLPELPHLPLTVRLKNLRLEKLRAPTALFFGTAPPALPPALGPLPQYVTLDGEATAALTGSALNAGLDLRLTTDAGQSLDARLRANMVGGRAGCTLSGALSLPLQGAEAIALRYALEADLEKNLLRLAKLELNGPGLNLNTDAALKLDAGSVDIHLAAAAEDNAARQRFLTALAGLAPEQKIGGSLKLDLDARVSGLPGWPAAPPLPAVEGTLALSGEKLHLPQAEGLIGPDLALRASFEGGGETPLELKSLELRSGIVHLSGRASCAPMPDIAHARLDADLALDLADLAPLKAGVSGPLALRLKAGGALNDLKAELDLSTPALGIPSGKLGRTAARLEAAYTRETSGALDAHGTLTASVAESPGGPGQISAAWRAALSAEGAPSAAGLDELKARMAGVDLNGKLDARFAPEQAFPKLTGDVALKIADWARLAALAGLPLRGEPADLRLRLEHPDAGQSVSLNLRLPAFSLDKSGVELRGVTLDARADKLLGPVPAVKGALRLGAGKAAILAWSSGSAAFEGARVGSFTLALRGGAAAPKGKAAKGGKSSGTAAGPIGTAGGTGGTGDVLALAGGWDLEKKEASLSRFALNAPAPQTGKQAGVRLAQPVRVPFDAKRIQGLKLAFTPKGTLDLDADLAGPRLEAKLTDFSPAFLRLVTDAALPEGSVNMQARFAVAGGNPEGGLRLDTRLGLPDGKQADLLRLRLDARLGREGGKLGLRGTGALALSAAPGEEGALRFALPLNAGADGLPQPDNNAPVSATFAWESAVAPLWKLVPLPGRTLDGRFAVEAALSGSLAAPRASGSFYLAGGRFEDKVLGLLLEAITAEAHGSQDGAGRLVLSTADGRGGSLALEASVTPGADAPSVALRGFLTHLTPLHRDDLSISLSGPFSASGPLTAPVLKADITVDRGELDLVTSLGGGVRTLDISQPGEQAKSSDAGAGPQCDLGISIPRHFFIRGRGMDSEWEGKLRITGPASAPSLVGGLRPVRGSFEILSRNFAFTGGEITFVGGSRINPGIALELTYTGPDVVGIINVSGSAQKPVLSLTSRPPLPRDEVLAHVLFGKNLSQLSRFETLQLADGVRELAGVGGAGASPVSKVRKGLGLDTLRLGSGSDAATERSTSGISGATNAPVSAAPQKTDPSGASGPKLEAGKYITDGVYVGAEQGATPDSTGVKVEIELSPHFNLQGKTSPRSSQVGIGWKWDY